MPEGPEVETIRRGLQTTIVGETVAAVDVLYEKAWLMPSDLRQQIVVGATVTRVDRRAKVLIIKLNNDYALLFHLKMTGQMVLVKADGGRYAGGHPSESMRTKLPDRSTRVVFTFASGDVLYFNDQRKFGWIKLVLTAEIEQDALVAKLGPEVLSPQFTVEYLAGKLTRRKGSPIKPVVLDQTVMGGVGNIYVDESLHLAKIHPKRLAGSLSRAEVKRLHEALQTIMAAAIEHGGTSFAHYVNSLGGKGDYLQHARVFRREGQPCPVCGTLIQKIKLAGRGTHFCPKCQVMP